MVAIFTSLRQHMDKDIRDHRKLLCHMKVCTVPALCACTISILNAS